ncbi:MoaD/ThiS family protein [Pedobacter mucosus]|uniref:MoaD/ThiS family protein n=1 Tax=Pedobacter mucosus TaxID=2895286 RepID=UPI001EE3DBDF|nr:MoaD/ThiS family protein [Pedobacter mucosus]UKT62252.1 MoaD/ThiS family protein [Pedobacter mucosus]
MATILIPTPLRKFTGNTAKLLTSGISISEILVELVQQYPLLQKHLLDSDGRLRSFINVFVDEDDIRNLDFENTEVRSNSIISIVPAIAGG